MESVGQLDEDDPDILGHRQRHLLEIFSLPFCMGAEFDLGQLADTVYEVRDGVPELGVDGGLVDAGILDDIVQHRRHQALVVHVHLGENGRHGQRVCYIGLATAPKLPVMGLLGEEVGALDLVALVRAKVGL